MIVLKEPTVFSKIIRIWEKSSEKRGDKVKEVLLCEDEWFDFVSQYRKYGDMMPSVYGASLEEEGGQCVFPTFKVKLMTPEQESYYPEGFHE